MSEIVNIKRIEDSVSNIGILQTTIESGNDSQTGYRMMGYKDSAGDTYKVLAKGKPAYIQSLNISEFATAGLLRTSATGVIYGDVNTLEELNTALGGTTIDESTDERPPEAHASDHTDGTDDIQDATASQKGVMTAAQAALLVAINANYFNVSTDYSDDIDEGSSNLFLTPAERGEVAANTAQRANAEKIWNKDIAEVEDASVTPGAQVVTNGDFTSDVTSWTAGNSATVTWQAGGIARIAYNGVANPYIIQDALETGEEHVFTGRARGDGTNIPALKAGATVWTALDATEWHSFSIIFTATSSLLSLTSGGATSGYVEWDYQYARKLADVPTMDDMPVWISRENLLPFPLDIFSWTKAGCTVDNATGVASPYIDPVAGQVDFQGIISNADAGSHYILKTATATAAKITVCGIFKPGDTDFIVMDNTSVSSTRFHCNIRTMEIGSISGDVIPRLYRIPDGSVCVSATFEASIGSNNIAVGPVSSLTGGNITGDGATINTYITRMHVAHGRMEDNIGFANGGAIPYPLNLEQELTDDLQAKHATQLVKTFDGAWEFIENVDGLLMDESPSNVAAMRQAGLYKKVSNDTWGPLVTGTQFYSERGYFYELYEDTSTASTTVTLAPSETPPTDNGANPLHSKGTVYTANDAIMVPSYCTALYYAGVRNVDGDMLLDFLTGTDTNRGYRVEVEYEWRNIVAPA